MASSQVEISSSAPFGCVLRDHHQRDVCRESNAHASFQKNLHSLVRDHLHSCISISSDSDPNENSLHQMNNIDKWVRSQEKTPVHNLRFTGGQANPSSTTSPVKSRMLEHWAAKQTQMVSSPAQSHLHSYLCESRPDTDQNNSRAFPTEQLTSRKDQSLPRSFKISNLGASSLVQLWEKRLNQTNDVNSNHSMSNVDSHSVSISELSHPDNTCPAEVAGDLSYERIDDSQPNNDSIASADWQSNTTPPNITPSASQDTNSEAGEKERVRVADIIRRLITVTQTQSPLSTWSEENDLLNDVACRDAAEHRLLSKVISSPRIRGRQAFADLLMQIERDRHRELGALVERHAVSKFSHRGRIQSMLRLRLLQRGLEVVGQQHLLPPVPAEGNRFREAPTIHIRQRFMTEQESGKASDSRNPCGENAMNRLPLDIHSASFQPDQCNHCEQQVEVIQGQSPIPGDGSVSANVTQQCQEEVGPSSDRLWNQTSLQRPNLDSLGTADSISLIEDWDEMSDEDDDEGDGQANVPSNFDWFTDISRPRSYWEDRRKEWYQEILSTGSDNEDIRQLLERRTVSNFLVSDFRERMDRLMVHRLERQVQHEEEQEEENQGRPEQLQSFPERHAQTEGRNENEGEGDEEEEEEEEEVVEQENEEEQAQEQEDEEESLGSGQYQEVTDYFDQSTSSLELPSPSLLRSWSFQDNEVSNDSERVASTFSPRALPSQSSYQDDSRQCSPSMNNRHPSLGGEAIYNLRKQMEQLYEEMLELRKSMKRCMEMQLDLQQSLKHQVENNSGGEANKSCRDATSKRHCCICYEMQVDSLLYRCGHMCTCLKCAHELQWSSGKCPICRAPIVDLVRAYTDS